MSCDQSNSPINIAKQSIAGACDEKCNLVFNYHKSNCNVTNNADYLELDYEENTKNPVKFNGLSLDVYKVRIYSPSVHTYNNERAEGEIIISHNGNGSNLLICVPFMVSDDITTECSKMLEQIVIGTSRLASKPGNRATLNVDNYNLNNVVPKLPYFFYEANLPYEPCNGNNNIVVFHTNTYATIESKVLKNLKKIISNADIKIRTGPNLYLSGAKAKTTEKSDIYISCKPVNKKEGFTNLNNYYEVEINKNNTLDIIYDNIIPIFIGSAFLFGILISRKK